MLGMLQALRVRISGLKQTAADSAAVTVFLPLAPHSLLGGCQRCGTTYRLRYYPADKGTVFGTLQRS